MEVFKLYLESLDLLQEYNRKFYFPTIDNTTFLNVEEKRQYMTQGIYACLCEDNSTLQSKIAALGEIKNRVLDALDYVNEAKRRMDKTLECDDDVVAIDKDGPWRTNDINLPIVGPKEFPQHLPSPTIVKDQVPNPTIEVAIPLIGNNNSDDNSSTAAFAASSSHEDLSQNNEDEDNDMEGRSFVCYPNIMVDEYVDMKDMQIKSTPTTSSDNNPSEEEIEYANATTNLSSLLHFLRE